MVRMFISELIRFSETVNLYTGVWYCKMTSRYVCVGIRSMWGGWLASLGWADKANKWLECFCLLMKRTYEATGYGKLMTRCGKLIKWTDEPAKVRAGQIGMVACRSCRCGRVRFSDMKYRNGLQAHSSWQAHSVAPKSICIDRIIGTRKGIGLLSEIEFDYYMDSVRHMYNRFGFASMDGKGKWTKKISHWTGAEKRWSDCWWLL